MQFAKKEYKKISTSYYGSFLLGGDIGGTNTTLGIFGIKRKIPSLLATFHFKSKELKELYSAINEVTDNAFQNYKIKISKCCLGVAGALSPNRDYVKVTNANLELSKNELSEKTRLKNVLLINDFEAVGYGINMINSGDLHEIRISKRVDKAPVLVIGAGTGLGKSTLIWNSNKNFYAPLPSEAHHSEFPVQDEFELGLIDFIKNSRKTRQSVCYGDLLSGEGIENIYLFLTKSKKYKPTKYTNEIIKSDSMPGLISKYRNADRVCKETFRLFKMFYARAARNFALDCLPLGGIYIAGGIAQKNQEIFDQKFVKIFDSSRKMSNILKRIPIYLILNTNVGLLGAGYAGNKFL